MAYMLRQSTRIKAIANPRRQSGQTVIKEFFDNIDDTIKKNPNLEITIIWDTRTSRIEENAKTDEEHSGGPEKKADHSITIH